MKDRSTHERFPRLPRHKQCQDSMNNVTKQRRGKTKRTHETCQGLSLLKQCQDTMNNVTKQWRGKTKELMRRAKDCHYLSSVRIQQIPSRNSEEEKTKSTHERFPRPLQSRQRPQLPWWCRRHSCRRCQPAFSPPVPPSAAGGCCGRRCAAPLRHSWCQQQNKVISFVVA